MAFGISIVVCTYNGAKRLPETIRHIALQTAPAHIQWEVIIIDNDSSDGSGEQAVREWSKYKNPVPFTILYQPEKGLTAAREMGFEAACYEFILLCDDDNWLCETYISIAFEQMYANSSIGMLGGHGELVFEEEPPGWLWDFRLLASGPQARTSGVVRRNIVYGAGVVIRKSGLELLQRSGYNPTLPDRNRNNMASGGDHELCYSFALAGYEIWYNSDLKFKHFITKERLTWQYYQRYIYESSVCFPVLEAYKTLLLVGSGNYSFWRQLFRTFGYLMKNLFWINLRMAGMNADSDEYKILRMKRSLLATRIRMCSRFRIFKIHFGEAVALKQRLTAVKKTCGRFSTSLPASVETT